jgi:hypothetical protein
MKVNAKWGQSTEDDFIKNWKKSKYENAWLDQAWDAVNKSQIMCAVSETTWGPNLKDKAKYKDYSADDAGAGFDCKCDDFAPPRVGVTAHHEWQMERKIVVYGDPDTRSKELASITMKMQGESWTEPGDTTQDSGAAPDDWTTRIDVCKYVIVVDSKVLPLEVEVLEGSIHHKTKGARGANCSAKWKTPMFTVQWDNLQTKTKSIAIDQSAGDVELAAFLGSILLTNCNPSQLYLIPQKQIAIPFEAHLVDYSA